ncbi:transposase family protein [Micromonospora sp. 15K316]|uniref:transposase family protein n=1 Tax=Micromonospora sp. 15K316 TaxID=2530376 RepID=UPI001405311C|nr:transposase family protein [Micromonospora sp. 15K316]
MAVDDLWYLSKRGQDGKRLPSRRHGQGKRWRVRFIAQVVHRATGRAVCLAFADGLQRFGVPEVVLTDNGKQFTDRFGKGGR